MPYNAPFAYTKSRARVGVNLYKYELPSVGQPFKIKVSRASTGEVIFDTSAFQFVYSNQYLEVSTAITNDLVYGLGERRMKTF